MSCNQVYTPRGHRRMSPTGWRLVREEGWLGKDRGEAKAKKRQGIRSDVMGKAGKVESQEIYKNDKGRK